MISEVAFAKNFTSLWRSLTPTMDQFVRRVNLDGYDREFPPLPSLSEPDRRGVINETGFRLFERINRDGRQKVSQTPNALQEAFIAASEYVYGQPATSGLDTTERREAIAIAGRLHTFFSPPYCSEIVTLFPQFAGNGIIDACVGDVMVGTSDIWEIKNGERSFRSIDFRQLATYAALHYAKSGMEIRKIGLLNARTGVSYCISIEDFSDEVSGQSPSMLLHALVATFSSHLVSG